MNTITTMPAWQRVISSAFPRGPVRKGALDKVLRSRQRFFPIALNGKTTLVPRAEVRDFLRAIL